MTSGNLFNQQPGQQQQQPQQTQQQQQAFTPPQQPYDPSAAVAGADPGGDRTPWIVEGAYPILYFDFPKWHTQEGTGVLYFISEFEVIQSNVEARPPGTRISFSRKMSNRAAPGDVKALVAALVGCDHTQINKPTMDAFMSSENPAHGRLVRCEAFDKPQKQDPTKNFTICRWSTLPDEVQAQAKQLRQQAGFAQPF